MSVKAPALQLLLGECRGDKKHVAVARPDPERPTDNLSASCARPKTLPDPSAREKFSADIPFKNLHLCQNKEQYRC